VFRDVPGRSEVTEAGSLRPRSTSLVQASSGSPQPGREPGMPAQAGNAFRVQQPWPCSIPACPRPPGTRLGRLNPRRKRRSAFWRTTGSRSFAGSRRRRPPRARSGRTGLFSASRRNLHPWSVDPCASPYLRLSSRAGVL
jgi:hypothetical protein